MKTQSDDGTLPTEQPAVTAQTQFARRGFRPAAEVIAEAASAGTAQDTGAQPGDESINEAIAQDTEITLEYPEGVIPEAAAAAQPEAQAAPQAEPKFKIGGREFGTQEEAWAYAEELEAKQLTADAFRQGVEMATQAAKGNPAPQAPEAKVPQEIDPEYYTNPQGYFEKREAEIIERAKQATQRELQRQQTHEQTWSKFYTEYPDLVAARELVDLTLQQNWDVLQHVKTEVALKQLADKTRAKLKPILDARLPKTELPKVRAAASPGGAQGVTPQKSAPQALSFVQQQKNLKRSRAQLP